MLVCETDRSTIGRWRTIGRATVHGLVGSNTNRIAGDVSIMNEVREEKRKVKTKVKERRVEKYGRKEEEKKRKRGLELKLAGVSGCGKGLPR